MSSLRSQKLEISAAAVLAISSAAAGLLGLIIGRTRANMANVPFVETRLSGPRVPDDDLAPEWQTLSEVEDRLRARNSAYEELRRDYELDTGLLKEELRRLKETLADAMGVTDTDTDTEARRGAPRHNASRKTSSARDPIQFSSLEDLVGRGSDGGP